TGAGGNLESGKGVSKGRQAGFLKDLRSRPSSPGRNPEGLVNGSYFVNVDFPIEGLFRANYYVFNAFTIKVKNLALIFGEYIVIYFQSPKLRTVRLLFD
ncbi:MAG: hypothetical protein AAF514_12900, partial [Verrucomicrobiota bacterium]